MLCKVGKNFIDRLYTEFLYIFLFFWIIASWCYIWERKK